MSRNPNAGVNMNAGSSLAMEYAVPPYEFTLLRTGGEEYDFSVDAVIFQAGRSWLTDDEIQNFTRHRFDQRI